MRGTLDSVSQIPLFAGASETVLADDERGRITYAPSFLSSEVASVWFAELRDSVSWKSERRRMYDREVDVPRLTAHFRLVPEQSSVPDAIRDTARKVVAVTGVPFNSVGLNFYRDGQDSVAPHGDQDDIVRGTPVALVSLGDTRRMTIRATKAPRRVFQLDLTAGSLLLMSYETQLTYTHAIPKTQERVGPRISLAFRVKPEPAARVYR